MPASAGPWHGAQQQSKRGRQQQQRWRGSVGYQGIQATCGWGRGRGRGCGAVAGGPWHGTTVNVLFCFPVFAWMGCPGGGGLASAGDRHVYRTGLGRCTCMHTAERLRCKELGRWQDGPLAILAVDDKGHRPRAPGQCARPGTPPGRVAPCKGATAVHATRQQRRPWSMPNVDTRR